MTTSWLKSKKFTQPPIQVIFGTEASRTKYQIAALDKSDAVFIDNREPLCFHFLHQGEKIFKNENRNRNQGTVRRRCDNWRSSTSLMDQCPRFQKWGKLEPPHLELISVLSFLWEQNYALLTYGLLRQRTSK